MWKEIEGYEGLYSVNEFGEILSHAGKKSGFGFGKERIMILSKTHNGYFQIKLTKNGIGKMCKIHRLVALSFIPNYENKKTINHKNGIKTDNNVTNLEWMTLSENILHAYRELGKKPYSGKHCNK